MFSFFKRTNRPATPPLTKDFHSHLLPGLDDGVESFEESIDIIQQLKELGYSKLVTTPHVMKDFYDNSSQEIRTSLAELKAKLTEQKIEMELEAAAEYYLDDFLMEKIDNAEAELLTFGNNYLLFETSFMNEPFYLNEFIFKAKSRGLKPVMAHPERYAFIHANAEKIDDLIVRGVLLQLNINSIVGYYSKQVKKTAEKLIDQEKVHFLGSDCHNKRHLAVLKEARSQKYYNKALRLPLLNDTI